MTELAEQVKTKVVSETDRLSKELESQSKLLTEATSQIEMLENNKKIIQSNMDTIRGAIQAYGIVVNLYNVKPDASSTVDVTPE